MDSCDYCGSLVPPFVINEDALVCMNCCKSFTTCRMCEKVYECPFETDPSPLPKVILQTMQQGPMTVQTQVRNPERVKQFCFPCECFDKEDLICRREDGWCPSYTEITPRFRQKRCEST